MELAFTTRLPLAVLIILGVKRWENRACCPMPQKGRCGMSVSKSSNESEYANFISFVRQNASERLASAIPSWRQVEGWRGKMIANMSYEVCDGPGPSVWDEGYQWWWKLSDVVLLDEPFPVRGSVGMWTIRR